MLIIEPNVNMINCYYALKIFIFSFMSLKKRILNFWDSIFLLNITIFSHIGIMKCFPKTKSTRSKIGPNIFFIKNREFLTLSSILFMIFQAENLLHPDGHVIFALKSFYNRYYMMI